MLRVSEERDQHLDELDPEVALPLLRGIVESLVPAFGREPSVARRDPGVSDGRMHEQRKVGLRVRSKLGDVRLAEPAVPAWSAERTDPALVRPLAKSRGMDAQPLGGFVQAQPRRHGDSLMKSIGRRVRG